MSWTNEPISSPSFCRLVCPTIPCSQPFDQILAGMNSGRVEFPEELIRGFSQGTCQVVQFFFCGPTIIVRADLEFSDEGFYCGSTIVSSQLNPRMTGRCCCRRSGS